MTQMALLNISALIALAIVGYAVAVVVLMIEKYQQKRNTLMHVDLCDMLDLR